VTPLELAPALGNTSADFQPAKRRPRYRITYAARYGVGESRVGNRQEVFVVGSSGTRFAIRSVNSLTPLDRFFNNAAERGRIGCPLGAFATRKRRITMPKYTFSLDKYDIKDTRSRHEDTNYVTAVLSVNGNTIGEPKTKFMGNQNNGTFPVGFRWSDVDVPEGSSVALLYQILNSGHKDHAALEQALGQMTKAQLTNDVDWKKWLADQVMHLAFADCDGPIAPPGGRRIEWDSFALKNAGAKFEDKQDEPGNDSPSGCGGNSHYIVHYTVAAA
jgi:hypothetical protein